VQFELAVAGVEMSVIGKMTLRVHQPMEVIISLGQPMEQKNLFSRLNKFELFFSESFFSENKNSI